MPPWVWPSRCLLLCADALNAGVLRSQMLKHSVHLVADASSILRADLHEAHTPISHIHLIEHAIQQADFAAADVGTALIVTLARCTTTDQHAVNARAQCSQRQFGIDAQEVNLQLNRLLIRFPV